MKLYENSGDVAVTDLILFMKLQARMNGQSGFLTLYWNEGQWKQLTEAMESSGFTFLNKNQFMNCKHIKI